MTILFICSSLEEGKDGIGDYTRKLAQECQLQGVSALLVSVNDNYVSQTVTGIVNGITFYRLPKAMSWKQKTHELLNILNNNKQIDWVSIQFQPFGFSEKGIIKNASVLFASLNKWKIHVMMHELWVGEERQASMKMKLLGFFQKRSILSCLKKMKPKVINTSIPLYNKMLNIAGVKSFVLPLFSNIQHEDNTSEVYPAKVPQILQNRDEHVVACLFGSIYYESWDLSTLFSILMAKKNGSGKGIIIVSIGKISYGKEFWDGLSTQYPDINFLTLGPQDEGFISCFLNNYVDIGVVTTPAIIAGKSGSCMAFLEHGIPVVCKQNDLSFNFKVDDDLFDQRIIQITNADDFILPKRTSVSQQLKNTTHQLIQTLNSFK